MYGRPEPISFQPIPVASREKTQAPFDLRQLTMMAFVTQNQFDVGWGSMHPVPPEDPQKDFSHPKARYTWFDVSSKSQVPMSGGFAYGYDDIQLKQQQFCLEIVMLDETAHIARNPTVTGRVEEYEDEFHVTGRLRRNAQQLNSALEARKNFT